MTTYLLGVATPLVLAALGWAAREAWLWATTTAALRCDWCARTFGSLDDPRRPLYAVQWARWSLHLLSRRHRAEERARGRR